MSIKSLSERLRKIEGRRIEAETVGRFGFRPVVSIVTESDEDEARQLAVLQAEGRYRPGQAVISRRIVDPPANRKLDA